MICHERSIDVNKIRDLKRVRRQKTVCRRRKFEYSFVSQCQTNVGVRVSYFIEKKADVDNKLSKNVDTVEVDVIRTFSYKSTLSKREDENVSNKNKTMFHYTH